MKESLKDQGLLIKIRYHVALVEWITATANADMAMHGKWTSDWGAECAKEQLEVSKLLLELTE